MPLPAVSPGRLLERIGDDAPRGMTVLDRTRLTGRLRHFLFCVYDGPGSGHSVAGELVTDTVFAERARACGGTSICAAGLGRSGASRNCTPAAAPQHAGGPARIQRLVEGPEPTQSQNLRLISGLWITFEQVCEVSRKSLTELMKFAHQAC